MRRMVLPVVMVAVMAASVRAADLGEREYVAGLSAMGKGDYAGAVKDFDKAVGADEANGNFLEARGVAKAMAEDLAGAMGDLKQAVKLLEAKDWEGKGWVGVVERMRGNFGAGFVPGVAPRGEQGYAVAMNEMGQNYGMSVVHGTYYDKGLRKTVRTERAYTGDFLGVAKMYVERHWGAGGAGGVEVQKNVKELVEKREYVEGLAELGPMLKVDPSSDALLMLDGKCLLGVGNVLEARRVFTEVLTADSMWVDGYLGRAAAAKAVGDDERMKRDLAVALEIDPSRRGEILELGGREAMADRLKENPERLWKELEGEAMKGSGGVSQEELDATAMRLVKRMEAGRVRYDERYQERRGELERGLAKEKESADRMVGVARFLFEEADVQGETVGPRDGEVLYRMQTEGMKRAEVARARSLVDLALAIDARNLGAVTLKAEMFLTEKNFGEAEDWTRRAVAMKADDPNLLELLAKLLEVDASYKITAAGNLRQPRDLFETRFDGYPPMIYHWVIYPTKEELKEAGRYEKEAEGLSELAMETIGAAVKAGGRTERGYYFDATTKQMVGDYAGAEALVKKALELDPKSEKALFLLAAIYTDEGKGDEAVRARVEAENLSETTDGAWLRAAWFKIPRGEVKGGREALMEAAGIDPADARVWAYLAVLDEAEGKREEAMGHWAMARAVGEARLKLRGQVLGEKGVVPAAGEEIGMPAVVRMRMGVLELESGKGAEAARDFGVAAEALGAVEGDGEVAGAMLPNPGLAAGVVPMAETVGTLKVRAEMGRDYAGWAVRTGKGEEAKFAGEMYRRLMVEWVLTTGSLEAFKAVGDLGMAELFLKSGEKEEARGRMRGGAAVPQAFWQEMRRVEGEVR